MKKVFLSLLLLTIGFNAYAEDSQGSAAKEVTANSGQAVNFEVDPGGSLFADIKGKRTLVANGKNGVPYASVTFSDNGTVANVYGPGGNLLRAIPCYQYCSDTSHSNHVIFMNSMDGSTKEMAPFSANNPSTGDYLIVFPAYVKIGFMGNNYYAYWRD